MGMDSQWKTFCPLILTLCGSCMDSWGTLFVINENFELPKSWQSPWKCGTINWTLTKSSLDIHSDEPSDVAKYSVWWHEYNPVQSPIWYQSCPGLCLFISSLSVYKHCPTTFRPIIYNFPIHPGFFFYHCLYGSKHLILFCRFNMLSVRTLSISNSYQWFNDSNNKW